LSQIASKFSVLGDNSSFSITELSLILSNSSLSEQATVSESLLKIEGHNKSTIFSNNSKSGLESNFSNS
jgi:hypothetical protein